MQTTLQLLDAVKKKHGFPSDYALAANLEVGRAAVSAWRRGHAHPGDENALVIAELLEVQPDYVVACIHADKAKTPGVLRVWKRLAKLSQAAAIMTVLSVLFLGASHSANEADFFDVTVYTLYAYVWMYMLWSGLNNYRYWSFFCGTWITVKSGIGRYRAAHANRCRISDGPATLSAL